MATTQIALGFPTGTNFFTETDIEGTVLSIKASGGTIYLIDIDNTANGAASYLKLYHTNGAVTLGTTVPDDVIRVAPSVRMVIPFPDANKVFSSGLQVACVTAGGTAGTSSPSSAVVLRLVYA